MDMSNTSIHQEKKFEMKKRIGLFGGIALSTGIIVGTGIFVSPVGVLRNVHGSVGLSLIIWVVCGIISILSALCYCELGATFGASGGYYNNFNLAYGPLVAFMLMWTRFLIHPGGAASLLIFARYFTSPMFSEGCHPPESLIKIVAIMLLFVLIFLNYRSVKTSVMTEIAFTTCKYLAMLVISVAGIVVLIKGSRVAEENFTTHAFPPQQISEISVSEMAMAIYQGLFPYNGWMVLTNVTEEIKDMKRNLPRATLISLIAITTLYIFVNIAYFSVLTVPEMLSSKAVGVAFANRVLGIFAWTIPVVVCLSTVGNQNGALLVSARGPYVAARSGLMPKILEMLHVKYFTPAPALMAVCITTMAYITVGDFDTLIYVFEFTSWTVYGLSAGSLIILRWKMPDIPRPFKVPIVVPVLVCIISIALVVTPLIEKPSFILFWAIGFYIISAIGYYFYIVKKCNIPGSEWLTIFLQKLLNVAQTDWEGFDYQRREAINVEL